MDKSAELAIKLVETLYQELKEIIGDDEIDAENIINVTVTAMKLLEKHRELKRQGYQKKQVVIAVIEKIVADKLGDSEEASSIMLVTKMFLPKTIDVIIALDKSEIAIKAKKCCKKHLCCF